MIRKFTFDFIKKRHSMPSMKMSSSNADHKIQNLGPLKLPVPSLDETLSKFLRSVRPLITSNEFLSAQSQVKKFSEEEGPRLQALLEKRAQARTNWLEEWWLKTAYLQYRDPVVLFSSPGLVWPQTNFSNENDRLEYAATLISAALEFNAVLDKRGVRPESAGANKLDMEQYYRVFGTTRVPLCGEDLLMYQNSSQLPNNIVVMINNNAFSLPVLDEERRPISTAAILGMLEAALGDAGTPGPPVGLLTTERRDSWARSYAILSKNIINVESFNEIDRALFVVCLDSELPSNTKFRNAASRSSGLLLHGGGYLNGSANAANRWYDKTIQFIIGARSDGVGIAYEHSPAEGGPIGVLADFVIDRLSEKKPFQASREHPAIRKLPFIVPPQVDSALQTAASHIDRLATDLDIFGFKFDDFGKNELKTFKTSPDSFVQIAIQYAFYKVHGKPGAQYESASLRKYTGGRTDVIRTCSEEALAFCQSRGSPPARADALKVALTAHKQYVTDAMAARGIDRHLLGLKLIAKENGMPVPDLFSHPAYLASTNFQLSTSNVGARNDAFMVYGPLVSDGYACCYNIRDNDINMGTSAWLSNPFTDLSKFQMALVQALQEMRDLLKSTLAKSKL